MLIELGEGFRGGDDGQEREGGDRTAGQGLGDRSNETKHYFTRQANVFFINYKMIK